MANKSPIPPTTNNVPVLACKPKGLDPNNLNDIAFEMVTMFVFLCVTKLPPPLFFFLSRTAQQHLSPPPTLFIN
jgi:hypothetical protein